MRNWRICAENPAKMTAPALIVRQTRSRRQRYRPRSQLEARTATDHAAAGAVVSVVQNRERRLTPGSAPVAVAATEADVSSDREIALGAAASAGSVADAPPDRCGISATAESTRRIGFSRPSLVALLAGAVERPSSLSFPNSSR